MVRPTLINISKIVAFFIPKGMRPLTKEQERFVHYEIDNARKLKHYKGLMRGETLMVRCFQNPEQQSDYNVTDKMFYLCFEILEGKHNDLLKHIIEATEERDNKNKP